MSKPFLFFLQCLRRDILGIAQEEAVAPQEDPTFFKKLFQCANAQDMAHMTAYSMEKHGIAAGDAEPLFQNVHRKALYRYEQLSFELDRVCALFEQEKIPYIPLKGAMLRKYYPLPYLRTSCDVDILVKEEHLDRACALLSEKLHYKEEISSAHDVAFSTEIGVHIELHHMLEEHRVNRAALPLADVWEEARSVSPGSAMHQMDDHHFYYYHIAHMARHITWGGCGIRAFLDLAILRANLALNEEKKNALLREGGLERFEKVAVELTDTWFYGKPYTPVARDLALFVAGGGVYGDAQNRIAVRNEGRDKGSYFWRRVWPSVSELKMLYPDIEEKPRILYPWYRVRRLCKRLFSRRLAYGLAEIQSAKELNKADFTAAKRLLEELELEF